MNKKHSKLFKILLFLFSLNSLSLYLYFSSSHHRLNHRPSSATTNSFHHHKTTTTTTTTTSYLKPWPILPSYLPWTQTPNITFRSCEAYFGNGFTRRVDVITPANNGGGWFRCHFSETLRSSICEGGGLRMVPERIKMSRGGEELNEVIGRGEEEELPEFENGAFQVLGVERKKRKRKRKVVDDKFLDMYVPEGDILRHTMRDFIRSMEIVDDQEFDCDQWIEEPVLLVTRFEYANLFHTITDWYSSYVASRVTDLPYRPHLIFVDGHCRTQLEQTWDALFSSLQYAKNFTGPVCFRHAILVPLGYETAMFKGLTEDINCEGTSAHELWQKPDDQKTARLSEFGEMIRAAFGFHVNRHGTDKPVSVYNVLFVRREDYLAHPRHGGKVESRLSNELEVFEALQNWVSNYQGCKINLVNGIFAHMSMKEQIQAIQEASVISGAHGAGLTHIVSAMPNTVILEIISSQFRRPHFQLIAQWKGLRYHAINLDGSYARPEDVINRLSIIMKSLGC